MDSKEVLIVGVCVALVYAVGMGLRGDWLPGVVGGALAGVLTVLVLREALARQARRAARRAAAARDRRG